MKDVKEFFETIKKFYKCMNSRWQTSQPRPRRSTKPRQIEIFNGQLRYYHGYQFWNGAPLAQWVSIFVVSDCLTHEKLKIDVLQPHTHRHRIYIRKVSSQILLCSGTFVSLLAGLGQKSILHCMLLCLNGP